MEPGTIRADFNKLRDNYPPYNNLPPDLFKLMVSLNNNETDSSKWTNTSCCVQVSHALNKGGIIVPPSSYRRPNAAAGGFYYLLVVDEVEAYLAGRFGRGEEIQKYGDAKAMKAHIDGLQGILLFRSTGLGKHVELWDENHILQDGKTFPGAGMDQTWCFSQPRVVFYEIYLDDDPPPPSWLLGWWEVYDGNTYYYYFNDEYVVTYTEKKPSNFNSPPVRMPGNEGEVSVSDDGTVEIDWSPSGGDQTVETFTHAPGVTNLMNGTSNRYSPLVATKK